MEKVAAFLETPTGPPPVNRFVRLRCWRRMLKMQLMPCRQGTWLIWMSLVGRWKTWARWSFQTFFFHPYFKCSDLTNIFEIDWNHQLVRFHQYWRPSWTIFLKQTSRYFDLWVSSAWPTFTPRRAGTRHVSNSLKPDWYVLSSNEQGKEPWIAVLCLVGINEPIARIPLNQPPVEWNRR